MSTATEMDALEALCAHNLKYSRLFCLQLRAKPGRAKFCDRLLETGDFSDFSVVCGDRTWKAHKVVLCRVEYFNKLITSGFKVCALLVSVTVLGHARCGARGPS